MQVLLRPSTSKFCGQLILTSRYLPTTFVYSHHLNLRIRHRHFTSTPYFSNSLATSHSGIDAKKLEPSISKETEDIYYGPLTTTFRRLKIFSLASLGLSVTLSPFMFILESSLPISARLALVSIALGSSSISTALVSWCAKPYVITLRRSYKGGAEEIEMTTVNLFLQHRITKVGTEYSIHFYYFMSISIFLKVYDPSFLIETQRPLAKWELAREIALTRNSSESKAHPEPGQEETIAETMNQKGEIIGRWVVKWKENGVGVCHKVGHVIRQVFGTILIYRQY